MNADQVKMKQSW